MKIEIKLAIKVQEVVEVKVEVEADWVVVAGVEE